MKKRLLIIAYSFGIGGTERIISYLMRYLNRSKFICKLLVFENNVQMPIPNDVCFEVLGKKRLIDVIKIIVMLRMKIQKSNPDVIITFLTYPNIITSLAVILSNWQGKLILSVRSSPSVSLKSRRFPFLKKIFIRYLFRKADRIIPVSHSILMELEQEFRIPKKIMKTVNNGIDLKIIDRSAAEYIHENIYHSNKTPIVVAVGRLTYAKGYDVLLKAMSYVVNEISCRLVIVGEGELRVLIEAMIKNLKLEQYVDLLGKKMNPYKYMAQSDVFVLSSYWEGFPNVILEAMACRTAVISSDCASGPREIIHHMKNGLLVKTGNSNDLSAAIIQLLKCKKKRDALANAGRLTAEYFCSDKMIKEYETLFLEE